MRIKLIVILFVALLSSLRAQDANQLFEQANQLYADKAYKEAEKVYQKILDQRKYSTELYFNLGNTYYKMDGVVPAIYYYEMALKLSPNDKEIKTNLSIAKSQLIDAVKPIELSSISKMWNGFLQIFSPFVWALLSVVFSICSAVAFMFYLFSQRISTKKKWFAMFFIFLTSSGIVFFLVQHLYSKNDAKKEAIIFTDEFWVKEEPILESKSIFQIHGGTKVEIEEKVHDWVKIVLQNGQNGWVNREILQEIKIPSLE